MNTKAIRHKYRTRSYGSEIFNRYPPGGADVHQLCDTIDGLVALVRHAQHQLPTEQQNEIERRLWAMEVVQ
jgi:hypothetical protein